MFNMDRQLYDKINNDVIPPEALDAIHDEPEFSHAIAKQYGQKAATAFYLGAIDMDVAFTWSLDDLREAPSCTTATSAHTQFGKTYHIPSIYVMRFDYEFMIRLYQAFKNYVRRISNSDDIQAHTVAEEYLIDQIMSNIIQVDSINAWTPSHALYAHLTKEEQNEIAEDNVDESDISTELYHDETWNTWHYKMFGDNDVSWVITEDNIPLNGEFDHTYAIENWFTPCFWVDDTPDA